MRQYQIRESIPQGNEEEMALLVPIYLAIWNDPENLRFLSFTGKLFQETQVRGWFSNHLASGVRYFVAIDDQTKLPVAMAMVSGNSINGISIDGIGVLPTHKGNGVGKRLIGKCVDVAREEGYRAIDAVVFANNFRMLKLLIGMEFQPIKMECHRGCDGSDLLYLKKYLS